MTSTVVPLERRASGSPRVAPSTHSRADGGSDAASPFGAEEVSFGAVEDGRIIGSLHGRRTAGSLVLDRLWLAVDGSAGGLVFQLLLEAEIDAQAAFCDDIVCTFDDGRYSRLLLAMDYSVRQPSGRFTPPGAEPFHWKRLKTVREPR